jgi:hypothetical protein
VRTVDIIAERFRVGDATSGLETAIETGCQTIEAVGAGSVAMRALPLVLACLGACSDPSVPIDAGTEELGAAMYCEEIADFFCDFYMRCDRMVVADQTECLSAFAESCEGRYGRRYVDLEAAGLLALSREGIDACEAHLAEVSCAEQVFDLDGPCRSMWTGLQPVAGDCSLDVEALVCEPGSECVLSLDLCGECKPVVAVGAACGAETTCSAEATCVDGFCVAYKNIGEACTPDDRCVISADCIDGFCVGPSFVGVGDSCDESHRCPYLSRCAGGTCVATQRLGGECATDLDCATGFCGEGGVCVELLANGSSCDRAAQCSSGSCEGSACAALPSACFQ